VSEAEYELSSGDALEWNGCVSRPLVFYQSNVGSCLHGNGELRSRFVCMSDNIMQFLL
jgi:hypothetical protein